MWEVGVGDRVSDEAVRAVWLRVRVRVRVTGGGYLWLKLGGELMLNSRWLKAAILACTSLPRTGYTR